MFIVLGFRVILNQRIFFCLACITNYKLFKINPMANYLKFEIFLEKYTCIIFHA